MSRLVAAATLVGVALVTASCAGGPAAEPSEPVAQTVQAVERPFTHSVVLEAVTVAPPRLALGRADPDAQLRWYVDDAAVLHRGQLVALELGTEDGQGAEELDHALERAERDLDYVRQLVELDLAGARGADRLTRARAELEATRAVEAAQQVVDDLRAGRERAAARTRQVVTPVAGVFSKNLGAESGILGWVTADTPTVEARIQPLVRLRLPDELGSTTVSIPGVATDLVCVSAAVVEPLEGDEDPSPKLRCALEPDVRLFPGLPAVVTVRVADLPRAVTIPVDAVRPGEPDRGEVVVVDGGGNRTTRQVELGPTDGLAVVVTSGLDAGEMVEFIRPVLDEGGDG